LNVCDFDIFWWAEDVPPKVLKTIHCWTCRRRDFIESFLRINYLPQTITKKGQHPST
jgi:hypothetical protein